jgi:predicted nuclease of predicted toxin-antitoxin system
VITKDSDFFGLLERFGPPPQILWITCGNTSNAYLRDVLQRTLPRALKLLEQGEPLAEISDTS